MALTGLRWLTTTVLMLLVGCASAPQQETDADRQPTVPISPPLIAAPEETPAAGAFEVLLDPVREALQQHDWMAAQLALPVARGETSPDPQLDQWLNFFRARIALQRGDTAQYRAELARLDATGLSPALRRALLEHRLDRAELAGRAMEVADLAVQLLGRADDGAPGSEERTRKARIEARLWRAVQTLADAPADAPWRSWWELAQAANHSSGARAATALDDWLFRYPDHPAAARAEVLLGAAREDDAVQRPALLIPLSGPLAQAGTAVGDGLLASWYASPADVSSVELLDSRRYSPITAGHRAALERGADQVIGPLGKLDVARLLAAGEEPPPIALNRPESAVTGTSGSLQLSLAPEDEAQQIARYAYADGGRRALLIRPEDVWGERMEAALLMRWRALGGELRSRALFGATAASHSASIQAALNLDASEARGTELRRLFGEIETSGRRREDIDVIFLLCKTADDARSLRPQISYHYAGDLPVYALSTLDDGAAPSANRDLDGIRLPVMPWRFNAPPPGLPAASAADAYAALHALGADAWLLAQRQRRLAAGADLRFAGHTGLFSVNPDGAILRELPMAEFNRGRLQRR